MATQYQLDLVSDLEAGIKGYIAANGSEVPPSNKRLLDYAGTNWVSVKNVVMSLRARNERALLDRIQEVFKHTSKQPIFLEEAYAPPFLGNVQRHLPDDEPALELERHLPEEHTVVKRAAPQPREEAPKAAKFPSPSNFASSQPKDTAYNPRRALEAIIDILGDMPKRDRERVLASSSMFFEVGL